MRRFAMPTWVAVMADLLALDEVRAGYGSAMVLDGIDLRIARGECVALLGRNGVGKTTLIATVMGLAHLLGGQVRWQGADIGGMATPARARAGLGWVPQERRVWRSLSVREHLDAVAQPGEWTPAKALALFPSLQGRLRHRGNELSGGEQQMLAIARALVTNPGLLLLDEPLEGLAPLVVRQLAEVFRQLSAAGLAMLLVEQRPQVALSIATRGLIMHRGRIVHDGESASLRGDAATLHRWLAP